MDNNKTPLLIMGGCFALFLLAILCVVCGSIFGVFSLGTAIEEAVEDAKEQKEKKEQDLWDNPAKKGEISEVGGIEWNLVEAKDLGSSLPSNFEWGEDCVAESGKFIYVQVKIKNVSDEAVYTSQLDLYDSSKRKFTRSSDVFSCVEEKLVWLEELNPGIEKTAAIVYEVPSDASGFKLKVGDLNLWEDEYAYINLGF